MNFTQAINALLNNQIVRRDDWDYEYLTAHNGAVYKINNPYYTNSANLEYEFSSDDLNKSWTIISEDNSWHDYDSWENSWDE